MKTVIALISALTLAACHESFEARLVRQAHDQTRINCPKRVDKFTILDSITFSIEKNEWCYCYTLIDSLDNAAIYTEDTRAAFHDVLQQSVLNNLELRSLKEHGINITYIYRFKSTGDVAIHETFDREDY